MIKEHMISKLLTKSRYSFNIFTYVAPTINLSFNSSTRILSTGETKVPFEGNLAQSGDKRNQFNDLIITNSQIIFIT